MVLGSVICIALITGYCLVFFIPKTVHYTYANEVCSPLFTLLPQAQKASPGQFDLSLKGELRVGRFVYASTQVCATPTNAPKPGDYRLAIAPLGGWFASKSVVVTVPESPTVKVADIAGKNISAALPLKIPLSTADTIHSYSLAVDGGAATMCAFKNSDAVVIYTLIAKRQGDIDELVTTLEKNGSLSKSIVIATTIFDSLVTSYLAPYVACAIGEYFWQEKDRDAVVIYDDLTSHAQIYREISLISGTNPGRDSYPGDIFYIHSSLLERAGKLHRNHKTLTALPVVLAGGGDVTAFLPTNIISITDGQWILDSEVFKEGFRPAVSSSLSVTRVGGRGHTNRQKDVAGRIQRALSAYRQALEYSHFGAELSTVTMNDLRIGTILKAVLNQLPGEAYPLLAQQLLIETILDSTADTKLPDISELKAQALMHSEGISSSLSYEDVLALFKKQYGVKG